MTLSGLMSATFYRHYWPAMVAQTVLNIGLMLLTTQSLTLNADTNVTSLFGIVWWLENFLLVSYLSWQNGHAFLWRQLWATPGARLRAIGLQFLSVAALTQLVPTAIWLAIQTSATLPLDIVAFGWVWFTSLSAILVAHYCAEYRQVRSILVFVASGLILTWTVLPWHLALLFPIFIFILLVGTFVTQPKLRFVSQQILLLTGRTTITALFVFSCLLVSDYSVRFPVLAAEPAQAIQQSTSVEFVSDNESERHWQENTQTALQSIPSFTTGAQEPEQPSSVNLTVRNLGSVQPLVRTLGLTYRAGQDIKTDWLSRSLKNPWLNTEGYTKDSNSYQRFMQQAELVWQNPTSTVPVFVSFQGQELAILNSTLLRYANSTTSVLWRQPAVELSWYFVNDVAEKGYLAFGNAQQTFLFRLIDGQPDITEFPTVQTPTFVVFHQTDSELTMLDVFYPDNNGQRWAWLLRNPNRKMNIPVRYTTTGLNDTEISSTLFMSLTFGFTLLWLLFSALFHKYRRQRLLSA